MRTGGPRRAGVADPYASGIVEQDFRMIWSRRAGLNRGPADYELLASLTRWTLADVPRKFVKDLV
jgi:hypothetical protein